MLTWTEKGERLDGEMHSRNLFSDAYTDPKISDKKRLARKV
jgi:hypothetical protein